MTAIEIIYKAQEINAQSSMLEISKAKKDLSMLADIVAGGSLSVAWEIANTRILMAKEEQEKMARTGQLIRIV